MNEPIPCCKNCRYSYGSGDHVYCSKNFKYEDNYNGCMIYEEKEDNGDEIPSKNE